MGITGLKAQLSKVSGGLACGLPVLGGGGGGSGHATFGIPTFGHGELVRLTLLVVLFVGSAVVMFRRWGSPTAVPSTAMTSEFGVAAEESQSAPPMAA